MRLIDADTLINVTAEDEYGDSEQRTMTIGDLLNDCINGDIPTVDAVEVVRCKDCKYWERKDGLVIGYCGAAKHGYKSTNWDIGIYRMTMDTGYCSDGERKDDGENREDDL